MPDHGTAGAGTDLLAILAPVLGLLAVATYLWCVRRTSGPWPRMRTVAWLIGTLAAVAAVSGPLAAAADDDFRAHMVAHVLLGMLAPLLLVRAAPVTLLLRAVPVTTGRRITRLLRHPVVRVATDPWVAAALATGGLWTLYGTGLYASMHTSPLLHLAVHTHLLLAGCLFATALVGVDPSPHRGYALRAVVLVLALAAHDILAKIIYAHPPAGVAAAEARSGAMIMYYGGDAVHLAMIILLAAGWYRLRARSRRPLAPLAARP